MPQSSCFHEHSSIEEGHSGRRIVHIHPHRCEGTNDKNKCNIAYKCAEDIIQLSARLVHSLKTHSCCQAES